MRIVVVGHSMVAERQQTFFEEIAGQGHDVLVIGPGEWGALYARPKECSFMNEKDGHYRYFPRRHIGEDLYSFRFLGAREVAEDFDPDWLYIQQEPGSALAAEALLWKAKRRAIFTWENINLKDGGETVKKYDLVVCGNPAAVDLVKPFNENTELMLQVGVDTDHFASRDIIRRLNVGYVGRLQPEKGLPYLRQAWPTVQIAQWTPFTALPWTYSSIKILVAFSQDIPYWREQAPNYVVLEALSTGCNVVVSDTPAMEYWLRDIPGVTVAKGHKQTGSDLDLSRIHGLKEGIKQALGNFHEGSGRQAVKDRFGNPFLARRLVDAFRRVQGENDGQQGDKLGKPV